MKSLFKTLTIVSLLGFSYLSLANDNPINNQFKSFCGVDEFGRDVCLNQDGELILVSKPLKILTPELNKDYNNK
ncbi:MAG TPA: hypothetical protein ACHBZA_04235 [Arsenophonus apicola]|jgi:hypothetical protein|uniref:hypothetical protein n=1 Tax=Arsenophonus TaxID=637 RepID=UPI0015D8A337|nr:MULTISPECIES: hypothetical protein [Arsenophonus]UBX30295.1 hypothetical protein LDL57_06790 [Arsenophonus apicola]